MFDERVVVRTLSGETLKGYGDNFLPGETEFMVQEVESGEIHRVPLAEVKMVCFVRAFVTDSQSTHRPTAPLIYQAVPGRRVSLEFADGERMEGVATLQAMPSQGFFVTPLNPNSNNLQVYVNPNALKRFRFSD